MVIRVCRLLLSVIGFLVPIYLFITFGRNQANPNCKCIKFKGRLHEMLGNKIYSRSPVLESQIVPPSEIIRSIKFSIHSEVGGGGGGGGYFWFKFSAIYCNKLEINYLRGNCMSLHPKPKFNMFCAYSQI